MVFLCASNACDVQLIVFFRQVLGHLGSDANVGWCLSAVQTPESNGNCKTFCYNLSKNMHDSKAFLPEFRK